ncbi:Chlorite dismutase [bacterium HR17]|uniref:Chlorite dismutase n=1 Tax=Candidatus Fervidibacter japonicus TaxID=2035412 RepID=A0A2H5XAR3_9BACT|nr:Chlorite dismutase [bacterium HR17]
MMQTMAAWQRFAEMAAPLERPQLPRNIHKSTERLVFCYQFFKVCPEWWALSDAERQDGKRELVELVRTFERHLLIRPYSTLGLKATTDFMLWIISKEMRGVELFTAALGHSFVGRYLNRPYTYLTLTRPSIYLRHPTRHQEPQQERPQERQEQEFTGEAPYFFIYPFTKTHEWYQLPYEQRREMMLEHFRIGNQFPTVRTYTSYGMGLDDYEFVVAFEADDPNEFQECVMRLREAKARPYTLVDTPLWTCLKRTIDELVELVL